MHDLIPGNSLTRPSRLGRSCEISEEAFGSGVAECILHQTPTASLTTENVSPLCLRYQLQRLGDSPTSPVLRHCHRAASQDPLAGVESEHRLVDW
jgi:hypothetical protein